MRLEDDSKEISRPLNAAAGCLKSIFGVIIFWVGFNSLLVGVAYSSLRGSWAPLLVGSVFFFAGLLLLGSGVGQIGQSLAPPDDEDDLYFL